MRYEEINLKKILFKGYLLKLINRDQIAPNQTKKNKCIEYNYNYIIEKSELKEELFLI